MSQEEIFIILDNLPIYLLIIATTALIVSKVQV